MQASCQLPRCRGRSASMCLMPIARLQPAHAAGYRALMLEAYARHPDAFTASVDERGGLPLAWWEARVAASADARELVLGAFEEGELAGVAGLAFESRPKLRHKASLFGMYVRPASRHLGLGAQLVQATLAEAANRPGIVLVQLTVSDGNAAARSLYERCGFSAFGMEPMAVALGDGYVGKVHMWRRIER
jgi:ribosomal protein S18 acetylase RimI-like enzyme